MCPPFMHPETVETMVLVVKQACAEIYAEQQRATIDIQTISTDEGILAEGAIALPVTLSGGALFAS